MAAQRVFVDTSGFYSLLVRDDSMHHRAQQILQRLRQSGRRACTTDYVFDETLTLLKARGLARLNRWLFELIDHSDALTLYFVGQERFQSSRAYFERHGDHGYSFTDCTSFVVMREVGATEALTKDQHFREAGFKALLI